jgi:hypothetical protein
MNTIKRESERKYTNIFNIIPFIPDNKKQQVKSIILESYKEKYPKCKVVKFIQNGKYNSVYCDIVIKLYDNMGDIIKENLVIKNNELYI